MADEDQSSLLFFDTFSHKPSDDLNLDLVQFPHPVLISKVDIIPLGTKVLADVAGGHRLGATTPSGFKLELFVNNLAKPSNATFEKLGGITFTSGAETAIHAEAEIPTDGLILKGWYSILTVGVFGTLTTVVKERVTSPPPPPPPQPVQPPRVKQEPGTQPEAVQLAPQPVPPPLPEQPREWASVPRQEPMYHPSLATAQIKQESYMEGDNRYVARNPLEMHHGRPPVPHQPHPDHTDMPPLPTYSDPHAGVRPPEPRPAGHPGEPPHGHIPPEPPHSIGHAPEPQRGGGPPDLPHGMGHPPVMHPGEPPHGMVLSQDHPIGPPPPMMHNPSMEGMGADLREIHEAMESFDAERRLERDRRFRNDARDGDFRDYRGSREGSRDRDSRDSSRESREHRPREHGRDRNRDREHDWDHERGRDWERRDRDREEWDQGKDWDKDRVRGRDDYKGRDKDSKDKQRPRSPLFRSRSSPRSRSPLSRESSRSREIENIEEPGESGEAPKEEAIDVPFDPMSPEPAGDMYVTLSDIEAQGNLDRDPAIEADDGGGYEDISDDDIDDLEDFTRGLQMVEGMFEVPEDMWNYTSYSPYQFELLPLTTFSDPSLSPYQVEKLKSKLGHKEMPQEALDVLDLVTRFLEAEHTGEWVEAMENLPSLLNNGLSYLDKEDILEALVSWTLEGLDFDKAIAQPENKYMLRHLKMGIKLVGCLCSCDVNISLKMMKEDVQVKLLQLYVTEHMSLSAKLQILRSLDQTLRFQVGMDWFLGQHPLQLACAEEEGRQHTAYQALLDIMMSKQLVRAVVAISAIMKKVHAYEVVRNFQRTVESFLEKSSVDQPEDKQVKSEDGDTADESEGMIDVIPGQSGPQDLEMDKITNMLDDLTKMHASALHAMGFPGRTLPAKVLFEITQKPSDPFPFLYHIWNSCNLLESIFSLLLHPATYQHLTAFLAVRDFVLQLLSYNSGLLFIASHPEIANGIIRSLLQNSDDVREDGAEENPPQQLGLQLVYYLQTLHFIDLLLEYHKKEKRESDDEQDMISFLHGLYIMTFIPPGRDAVTKVASLGDNMKALISFLEFSGNEARDGSKKRSVPVSYAANLLVMIIQDSDNVEMLERFGSKLYTLSDLEIHPKLSELKVWLDPIKKLTEFSYTCLDELMVQLKQYSDEVMDLPRGLVTVLRIIHHWGIPSERETLEEGQEELRYKFVLSELFTGDCMPLFQNILSKLFEIQQRPWQQGSYLATTQGQISMAITVKIVAIVKAILQYLIMARGPQFRDTTYLPSLFSVHTIVCSAPPGGLLTHDAQKVQNDIIDTIMAFTQPSLESYESEDVLTQSLWTKTLEELFKYTLSAPYTYMSGLLILSELLPLPLPIQTKEQLSDDEVAMATNQRKLWSAHLLCCNTAIQDVIKTLATTSCQPLQHVMRRVCWQLADLSMPTALNLVKHILDLILDGLESITEVVSIPGEGDKTQQVIIFHPSSGDMAQALNLLSYLLSQAPVKAPVLYLLRSGGKNEERYVETLPKLLHLLNVVSEKSCHIQAQECIVSIIQSLCDPEIVLITGENMGILEQLSICLPSKDHLHQICLALLDHIGNMDHSYASILPALRTLVMLTEHDYGFFHLKGALDQNHFAFCNLFMRINNTFSKDSSDCLSTLSTATELLHLLVTLEAPEEDTPLRTFVISVPELRQYLSWSEEREHPLYDLEKLLVECAKEEEALDSLLEGITSLLQDLRSNEPSEKKELVEPILPTPESLANQFNSRPIFVLTDGEDDRLSINYWMSCPGVDDSDQECELVPCNLEELTLKCNLDFDLKAELSKGTGTEDPAVVKARKRQRLRGARDTINTSSIGRGAKGFVAPMRGRGFNRGMNSNRHDPFRSRPPNTSRPPSMHVDDFVKMESQQGPPKPGGAGSGPPRRDKEFGDHRGRGGRGGFDRGRGGPGRGRFFTPPGNYGRRDGMNTRGLGNRGGLSRGGPLPQSRGPPGRSMQTPWGGRSKQMSSPRGFGGRGRDMDNRPGSAERHSGRGDIPRFPSRGGAGSGGRGGRGQWISPKSRDDTRFMPPPGGGFRGRRDQGRHVRSFTK
ncbi:protein virilizer homolog isoform X2 [Lineus longissimus]|uniref:protein virilizer homolog isoform X2 n=1 Tax=Lineus longissimus TaxID=88925 RepID=UPI00315C8D6F